LVDPSRSSAIDNLHAFTDKGITFLILDQWIKRKGFDQAQYPSKDSDNDDREDDAVEEDFKYDSLKKKMKKEKTSGR
jgi:hypothetical protein